MKFAPFDLQMPKDGVQLNKSPPLQKKVQLTDGFFAPFIFSTPFPIIRYQNLAGYGEWCCFFCDFSAPFTLNREKYVNFSVLHKAFTAFAYRIRAPPSEV